MKLKDRISLKTKRLESENNHIDLENTVAITSTLHSRDTDKYKFHTGEK